MGTDQNRLIHGETTRQVIGAYYDVYNAFGSGFLESVYENALMVALRRRGVEVRQQVAVDVYYDGVCVGEFRVDLLVPGKLVVEVKSIQAIGPSQDAQLINYLKATRLPVGLILNFGATPEIRRRIAADRIIGFDPLRSVVKTNV